MAEVFTLYQALLFRLSHELYSCYLAQAQAVLRSAKIVLTALSAEVDSREAQRLCPGCLMDLCAIAGIKPNVSAFGADQFDESDPQVSKARPLRQPTCEPCTTSPEP